MARPRQRDLKLGFFGAFFPEFQKAGNSSTGIVLLLSRSSRVQSVRAYVPVGSQQPPGLGDAVVNLEKSWQFDDPVSLLRTGLKIITARPLVNAFLFNIHITSFGKRAAGNALGITLPVLVRIGSRVPVVVYMHNFLESQDVARLGYSPSFLTRWVVRALETVLIRTTKVVVPLKSQSDLMNSTTGGKTSTLFFPYIEVVLSLLQRASSPEPGSASTTTGRVRVLLFGHWGPQKDADGAFEALANVIDRGTPIEVTVAGAVNSNFPEFGSELARWKSRLPEARFTFLPDLSEQGVLELIRRHDILFLPYHAAGGYSGALNAAAATGIRVIAYDLPQLRETAQLLESQVTFVRPTSGAAVQDVLIAAATEILQGRVTRRAPSALDALKRSEEAVSRLVDVLEGAAYG